MRHVLMAVLIFVGLLWLAPLFFGLMHGWVPFVAIGFIFWGASGLMRPRHYRRARAYWRPYEPRRDFPPAPRPAPASPAPASPARVENRLPLDVEMKAAQIRRKVEVLQKHAAEFPLGSEDLYLVGAIASDYLPHTLEAYLSLPPRGREKYAVVGGKTALEELRDQVNLLDSKLDEIAQDLERRNVDRLVTNRRFLEERFS